MIVVVLAITVESWQSSGRSSFLPFWVITAREPHSSSSSSRMSFCTRYEDVCDFNQLPQESEANGHRQRSNLESEVEKSIEGDMLAFVNDLLPIFLPVKLGAPAQQPTSELSIALSGRGEKWEVILQRLSKAWNICFRSSEMDANRV